MKKFLFYPILLSGFLFADNVVVASEDEVKTDIEPKMVKYLDKSYLNLETKGFRGIDKIVNSSVEGCILLEKKILYCEYGDDEEIKLKIQIIEDNQLKHIYLLLMQADMFPADGVKKPTLLEKNGNLLLENKELKLKLESMYQSLKQQEKMNQKALKYKEEVKTLKEEVAKYDEIIKENSRLCEVEKTEILALTKNKKYKELKDYTTTAKQLEKIKEQQESIRELLAIIDKYKSKNDSPKSEPQEENKSKSGSFGSFFKF